MDDRKIKVTISPLGDSTVEAIGFDGVGCQEATEGLEKALAGEGGFDRVLKPEWHNEEESEQEQELHW